VIVKIVSDCVKCVLNGDHDVMTTSVKICFHSFSVVGAFQNNVQSVLIFDKLAALTEGGILNGGEPALRYQIPMARHFAEKIPDNSSLSISLFKGEAKDFEVYIVMNYQKISSEGVKYITQIYGGSLRNLFLGAGICYAIERKEYEHIPLIYLFPSIYSGYHLFKRREEVKTWLKDFCPRAKRGVW